MSELDDALLARQQAYYNAPAPEYNEWWERRGRYDHGPVENAAWFAEQEQVYGALAALNLRGDVLELACGIGNWTLPHSRTAGQVTAVDGSAEMIAINRARVGSDRVRYVQADLFAWEPDQRYDAVVFCFGLSHVPPDRLDPFLGWLRCALKPGGAIFFVDSRRDPITTTADQPLPTADQPTLTRRLNDGREFPIVKVFYRPEDLEARFRSHGLAVRVEQTSRFFIYGSGYTAA